MPDALRTCILVCSKKATELVTTGTSQHHDIPCARSHFLITFCRHKSTYKR